MAKPTRIKYCLPWRRGSAMKTIASELRRSRFLVICLACLVEQRLVRPTRIHKMISVKLNEHKPRLLLHWAMRLEREFSAVYTFQGVTQRQWSDRHLFRCGRVLLVSLLEHSERFSQSWWTKLSLLLPVVIQSVHKWLGVALVTLSKSLATKCCRKSFQFCVITFIAAMNSHGKAFALGSLKSSIALAESKSQNIWISLSKLCKMLCVTKMMKLEQWLHHASRICITLWAIAPWMRLCQRFLLRWKATIMIQRRGLLMV
mmetsp:Transcript_21205/g.44787  ORF Transcript_21205/g.44787 Transcript_21205/m.44787 type:complete len:259 (+) Transcript_21205:1857-2633(+)